MNNTREILQKYNIHPKSYRRNKRVEIIESPEGSYVLKKDCNNYDIYQYLNSRNFTYYPNNYNDNSDNYDLSTYIEDVSLNKEQKLNDLIYILSTLHYKTSFKRELDLDEIKAMYEEVIKKIEYLISYYRSLNDYLDTILLLSPSEYLLVRNISLVYQMLDISQRMMEDWYQSIQEEKSMRVSLIHNNVDLDHLLVNNSYYLISWDYSRFDMPVIDLVTFYQKYYKEIDLKSVLHDYETINKLSKMEMKLLLAKLSIPLEIKLSNTTFNDTKRVNDLIIYLKKVYKYIETSDFLKNNNKETSQ